MNYDILINNFLNVLNNFMTEQEFSYIKQKLLETKIKYLPDDNALSPAGTCGYMGDVEIHENNEMILYHELFHVISTYYSENTDTIRSGFHHWQKNKQDIGFGLNEGYTEYMTVKCFGANRPHRYENEFHYASLIELLIGEQEMFQLYFNSNLDGLIDKMSMYNSKEKVVNFLENLDLFIILKKIAQEKEVSTIPSLEELQYWDEYRNKLEQTHYELTNFIFESFSNKYLNSSNELERDKMLNLISNFMENKGYVFDINNKLNGCTRR